LQKVKIANYKRQVEKILAQVNRNRNKYLVVCTGHQGEPGSILDRISRNILPLRLNENDNVVFSSSVIPTDINKENFAKLEQQLLKKKARIFRDVHVSGHAGREDLRDLIAILKPQHIIPAHGGLDKTQPMFELSQELGYTKKTCHLMQDGDVLEL
jgi:ribonuclease J